MNNQKKNNLKAALLAMIAAFLVILLSSPMQGFTQSKAPGSSGTMLINDLNYYYEIRGEGLPLVLLHGGLGSFDMFEPILPLLLENRQVIGVDLQGHGRTELGDKPIDYSNLGDDLSALLKQLGYEQVDVMGYSMGAGVALQLAIQHPEMIRRLVVVSAGFSKDGFYPEMIPQQEMVSADIAPAMKGTPMHESYSKLAPNPDDFPRLLDRMGELMRKSYNWSDEVKQLEMPIMLIFGDSDMFRPEHIIEFYQLLGGGLKDAGWQRENMPQNRLAILPNLTHYDIFLAPELAETALSFLNAENAFRNWSEQVQETQN